MRFSSSAVALAVVSFTSALPANTYSSTTTDCTTPVPSSASCSSSSPTPQPCKPSCPPVPDCKASCQTPPSTTPCDKPAGSNIIRPKVTSQYDVWTGAVRRGTRNGKIFKDGRTTDITTLLTFDFPSESAGKTCSFHFDLSADSSAKVSGTGQFDVFTSLAPAAGNTSSWAFRQPKGPASRSHDRAAEWRSNLGVWVPYSWPGLSLSGWADTWWGVGRRRQR